MTVFLLSAMVIGVAMLAMGVGVVLSNRCLRGTCADLQAAGPDGEPLACAACPRRSETRPGDGGSLP